MSNGASSPLNDCGCCEGVTDETPVAIKNLPGLAALAYRVGTQSRFKQSMQVDLSRHLELAGLKTRRDDDPAIGLLDAWATALDVLTFYQERIANEGYLRTATERVSLLELAREIGYELRTGVAASTYLAFSMETAAGAPSEATLGVGTKAQSIPEENQQAQIFETIEEIKARPAWNAIRPRTTQAQALEIQGAHLKFRNAAIEVRSLYFDGINTGLAPGDWLLVTTGSGAATLALPRRVARVTADNELKRTQVQLEASKPGPEKFPAAEPTTQFEGMNFPATAPALAFNATNIEAVLARRLRERDLQTRLELNHWKAEDLTEFVARRNAARTVPGQTVFAFRERAGFFGNNAPPYLGLVDRKGKPLYPVDWDAASWPIWARYPILFKAAEPCLERSITGILNDSWAMFADRQNRLTYRVVEAHDTSISGFGMSGKTTALSLQQANGKAAIYPDPPAFSVRETTAWVKSQELELAPLPVSDVLGATTSALQLDGIFLGLKPGRLVALSGEQWDAPGVIRDELLRLQEIIHHDGYTTILFQEESAGAGLLYSYVRKTVTLNANVASATHGETKREVLGNGDGSQAFQKFVLKQGPLTYVSAPTPSGLDSTLEMRVNDVLWEESGTLYRAPGSERTFVTHRTDEGKTITQFGDGVTGARLPSGTENVTATYRVGLGLGGMVKAKQISLLLTRPPGLKEVVNPLPANGGADAETREEARENAPFTVLTLDRIVSLQDFEDYARAYPGIGKAQATWLWQGEQKVIHLTIAGADGNPIPTVSALYKNLKLSMDGARDPGPHVLVGSYVPLSFDLRAKLLIRHAYLAEKVRAAAVEALLSEFSFHRRAFGQAVTKSEIFSVIQKVAGVDAVDLDSLFLSSSGPTLQDRLAARVAGWDQTNTVVRPAELLLINPRGIQLTDMSL